MKKMHLTIENHGGPNLCGGYTGLFRSIRIYIKYPNFRDHEPYYSMVGYEWCPDCLKHPEIVMLKLNETNV